MGACAVARLHKRSARQTLMCGVARSYLFHQKEMLEDQQRMQAYYDAVFKNKSCFEGKVRDSCDGAAQLLLGAAAACCARDELQLSAPS